MENYPKDIYTEPEPDADTLANLGPLTAWPDSGPASATLISIPKLMARKSRLSSSIWRCSPLMRTNGPQLFYGLRYHTRIVKPDDVETFHDQVGYWLWEPATGTIIQTLVFRAARPP